MGTNAIHKVITAVDLLAEANFELGGGDEESIKLFLQAANSVDPHHLSLSSSVLEMFMLHLEVQNVKRESLLTSREDMIRHIDEYAWKAWTKLHASSKFSIAIRYQKLPQRRQFIIDTLNNLSIKDPCEVIMRKCAESKKSKKTKKS